MIQTGLEFGSIAILDLFEIWVLLFGISLAKSWSKQDK
jgi:hypothetical protein